MEPQQRVSLVHRGEVRGVPWVAVRPEAGEPPSRQSVRCAVCDRTLIFTVHGVAATRRRRVQRLAAAWAGFALALSGLIGACTADPDRSGDLTGALALLLFGVLLGYVSAVAAAEEAGITGHGTGRPFPARHTVAVLPPRPADMPELVCPRCGHHEDSPWGSHLRDSYVREEYEAARERLAEHRCGEPGPE
ncbi:hypothetical protein RM780_15360 [Streptomyces sp. DSM 44917]|uniref:Uncharacterized protein n=1 Tax=Streptomyces boetiae TaxID=3075541 RepID=A0ABU2L9S5_9ACTN|nr:hypothetical protein [Streptomyces sp. DSM 44917]